MQDRLKKAYARLGKYPGVQAFIKKCYLCLKCRGYRCKIKGKGNKIENHGAILKKCRFEIEGDENLVVIGNYGMINGVTFHIKGTGHRVEIGEGCFFNHGGSIWMEDDKGRLSIGKNTSVVDMHVAVTEGKSVQIGERCLIANDVDVRTGDSHSIIDVQGSMLNVEGEGEKLNPAADVVIGDRVWLAEHVSVLKGAKIGSGSVVGTRSVVTGEIPENVVAVGMPARVMKDRVTWRKER